MATLGVRLGGASLLLMYQCPVGFTDQWKNCGLRGWGLCWRDETGLAAITENSMKTPSTIAPQTDPVADPATERPSAAPSSLPPSATEYTADSLPWYAKIFSFPAMLASFLVGAVFVAARTFTVDPDLWWHIRTGDLILRSHRWPTVDSYSYTVAG